MVDDTEGVDEVVRLDGNKFGEFFGIAQVKPDAILQPIDPGPPAGELQRLFREFYCGDPSAVTSEPYRIGADAAADFQHSPSPPALELCEPGDVGLYEVLTSFYLVEVLTRPQKFG